MELEAILELLHTYADEKYRQFNESLIPGAENTSLGVRLPKLREIAKGICRENWREFLHDSDGSTVYELKMLRGLVIAGAECDFSEQLRLLQDYVPTMDNWAVCDSLCSSLKATKKHLPEAWEFLQQYLNSTEEFQLRFGIVMLMDYFLTEEYIDRVLEYYRRIRSNRYYVNMALAWGLSVCFVKFRDKTLPLLRAQALSPWVQNKAIGKCRESYRLSDEDKALLRTLKV